MKYKTEMQVRYVPLPVDRRITWLLALEEIWARAKEISDAITDRDNDSNDEFDFGC